MRRVLLIAVLLTATNLFVLAQDACRGLKNPTSFSYYTTGSGRYSARVGNKNAIASTCSSMGMTFTGSILTGDAITNAIGGRVCQTLLGTDYQNEFAIKSSGSDALTSSNLSYLPNSTFTNSIRIGNSCAGHEANMLCYDFTVSYDNALVYLYFAISLENALHNMPSLNPEFTIKIKKWNALNSTYETLSDTMCYIVQSPIYGAPLGVFTSGGFTGGSGNIYRPWEKVVINLYQYLYQNVRIEVTTSDCSQEVHYGYCYIAGQCAPMRLTAIGCASGSSDTVSKVAAPSGLESYQWYASVNGITNSTDTIEYTRMIGCTDSVLNIRSADFVPTNGPNVGTNLTQRTFLCRMMSRMNPAYPIYSSLQATVGNMKPTLSVDTTLYCSGLVHLKDISTVAFTNNSDSNNVDTLFTVWRVFGGMDTLPANLLYADTAASIDYTFNVGGEHAVLMRTHSYKHSCWNEKTVHVRSLVVPTPKVLFDRDHYCIGDTVNVTDITTNPINNNQFDAYRRWVLHHANGETDTTDGAGSLVGGRRLSFVCDTTITYIEMWSRSSQVYYRDTNYDGIMEHIYCFAYLDTVVPIQSYPQVVVTGDTVVCKGSPANAVATALDENGGAYAGCTFAWYEMLHGTTPVIQGATLEREITGDKKFYVTATSSYGCTTWDSVTLMLVDPMLTASKKAICTGDTVMLYGSKAATYEWSSNPDDDASFWGQEHKDTIIVSPKHTTSYTVVGKGSNGCGATAISQKITVYDYPIPTVQLTPGYIDSENPRVQFNDVSPNGTNSLWNFGNGETSTTRSIVHTFTHLNEDSILIILNSCNPLGCCNDTQFYIPVGIFSVWYPNAFTPRLENNNTFHAYTNNVLVDYEIFIYNRHGILVFHSVDPHEGWNGFCNDEPCPQGAYVYIATYKRDDGSTRTMSQKGTVTLLR
jgi:gliding motility-associated-like protein